MTVQRTYTVDVEITPQELAAAFCDMDSYDQSAFFAEVWAIASTWPGAGLCRQSCEIMRVADLDAISAVETIASYLPQDALRRLANELDAPA